MNTIPAGLEKTPWYASRKLYALCLGIATVICLHQWPQYGDTINQIAGLVAVYIGGQSLADAARQTAIGNVHAAGIAATAAGITPTVTFSGASSGSLPVTVSDAAPPFVDPVPAGPPLESE